MTALTTRDALAKALNRPLAGLIPLDWTVAQPPKLRSQYVAALRLYAEEPWRLTRQHSAWQERHPHGA